MGKIYKSVEELIGGTPLLEVKRIENKRNIKAMVLLKLEMFNPAGSAKDRVGMYLINDAEEKGVLTPGSTIVEPTSGNTGVGLAAVGVSRGYRVILTMPDSMSKERISLLKAYGAEIVLTPGAQGMKGAIEKANEIAAATPKSFIPGQFENPANAKAHFETTGPEIWTDTFGKVDIFVAGVGTGGTITGTGGYLKKMNPAVKVVAVEPDDSPVLSGGKPGAHGLMGIGAGFIPDVLDINVYDEVIRVKTEDAYKAARELVSTEGILAGITSGAALHAALQLAERPENAGKVIVALIPDTGERYLSTPLYSE